MPFHLIARVTPFCASFYLLHCFRCHPSKAIRLYHNPSYSPLVHLLSNVGLFHLDPRSLIYICDSAFGDCCGSPIDFSSFAPDPVAMSNTLAIGIMSAMHIQIIHKGITHGDSS